MVLSQPIIVCVTKTLEVVINSRGCLYYSERIKNYLNVRNPIIPQNEITPNETTERSKQDRERGYWQLRHSAKYRQ